MTCPGCYDEGITTDANLVKVTDHEGMNEKQVWDCEKHDWQEEYADETCHCVDSCTC